MNKKLIIILLFFYSTICLTALDWIKKPSLIKNGEKWSVTFELSELTNVEVAIINAKGKVVRHLAAGVLGKNPPAPLKANSKAQTIEWDGLNDTGKKAQGSSFKVQVRAGLSVKLDKIVGGNPYAFFSKEMNSGNHAAWRMAGLELKSDGSVYVYANSTFVGPPVIRRFNSNGDFVSTVFPPPAGKPIEKMKGWGLIEKNDGTYNFKYRDLGAPIITTSYVGTGHRGYLGMLIPTPHKDKLAIFDVAKKSHFSVMTINSDGTISKEQEIKGKLINSPSLFATDGKGKYSWKVGGPYFSCLSPDKKHYYVSGLFARKVKGRKVGGATKDSFWRDGQVFKVDIATGTAKPFFALDKNAVIESDKDRIKSPIASKFSYCALHGVATHKENVFVCDRQNKRVLVLDQDGKIIKELPLEFPDDISVSPKTGTVYVTTRVGDDHRRGEITLVKFKDWKNDIKPTETIKLCKVVSGHYTSYDRSFVIASDTPEGTKIWIAFKSLPVRIYNDKENKLTLHKDFYQTNPNRCLDMYRLIVDRKKDDVYVVDSFSSIFRVNNWSKPSLDRVKLDEKTNLKAVGSAVYMDSNKRQLYTCTYKAWSSSIWRYKLDGKYITPANTPGTSRNLLAPKLVFGWKIGYGHAHNGFGISPNGNVAALEGTRGSKGVRLKFYKEDKSELLWEIKKFASKFAGSVYFDQKGNLYAGTVDKSPSNIPKGFAKDRNYKETIGRIYKYSPTGSLKEGNFYPTKPKAPTKIYDVHFGDLGGRFFRRPSFFSVDDFGHIIYPNSLASYIGIIDNNGNEILRFGTYGNADSSGGLSGDLIPTKDIPIAYPKSVDASDNYIYVTDQVNSRLLRIKKIFKLESIN